MVYVCPLAGVSSCHRGDSNPARVTSVAASYTRQADQLHCFTTIGLQFQICRRVHRWAESHS